MDDIKRKTPARNKASKKKAASGQKKTTDKKSKADREKPGPAKANAASNAAESSRSSRSFQPLEQQFTAFFENFSELTGNAMKLVNRTREEAGKSREKALGRMGGVPSKKPSADQLRQMADAGESLRDLRQVAGLTLADISKALNLKDKSVLEAVEDGKEALSMEMIMRLASLYARNDPIPFVVKYVRTYRPKLWATLEGLGLDGLPIKIERERQFLNIYKRRDAARQLSSEGFEKVLAFTQEAFELALHFTAELEQIENTVNTEFANSTNSKDTSMKS